jgi:hypothetical protein
MPEHAGMSEYWKRIAAKLREGLEDEPVAAPEPANWHPLDYEQGVDPIDLDTSRELLGTQYGTLDPDPMPDLAPSADLLKIVAMARRGTRDIIDLSDKDWQLLIDETFFRIACALCRDESVVLPNIGKIEIVWGEVGPYGRVTLDEAARPEVVL